MGLCVSKQSKQTTSMKMVEKHNMYVPKNQKHGEVFTYKSEANIYEQDFQDYLRSRLLSLEQDFIKFLKPSDVIFDIQGLNICRIGKIMETETTNRLQAVKLLLSTILEDSNLLLKFLYALEVRANMSKQIYKQYQINELLINGIAIKRYFANMQFLYKNGGLEQPDKEHIEAINSTRGRTAACQELFLTVARRNSSWALLLVEAIRETQEYVKTKHVKEIEEATMNPYVSTFKPLKGFDRGANILHSNKVRRHNNFYPEMFSKRPSQNLNPLSWTDRHKVVT
ncbi:unnamed protein product [Mytilus edulis]|uniref:Uncharacterized protein n=1 Tax=Mytilus edulis TaxID=6550 RepID=A0A8S3R2W0_MYTED|nr:unnamed protein product [Mytilus edulis]